MGNRRGSCVDGSGSQVFGIVHGWNWLVELTFPEFHFETEAKVDFPSACI